MTEVVREHLEEARAGLEALLADEATLATVARVAGVLAGVLEAGGTVFSCGNGGSLCDAMHFAEELSGRYREDRPAFAAMAISDPSHLTCVANDYGYEQVFSRFLEGHGRAGDALVAFTTSGSSRNVIRAMETARERGMTVVLLTGRVGSEAEGLADAVICTPAGRFADRVQELHIKVVHILIDLIERLRKEG